MSLKVVNVLYSNNKDYFHTAIQWFDRIVSEDTKKLFQEVLSSLKNDEKCQLEKIVSSLCFHFSESYAANMVLFRNVLAM